MIGNPGPKCCHTRVGYVWVVVRGRKTTSSTSRVLVYVVSSWGESSLGRKRGAREPARPGASTCVHGESKHVALAEEELSCCVNSNMGFYSYYYFSVQTAKSLS